MTLNLFTQYFFGWNSFSEKSAPLLFLVFFLNFENFTKDYFLHLPLADERSQVGFVLFLSGLGENPCCILKNFCPLNQTSNDLLFFLVSMDRVTKSAAYKYCSAP